MLHTDGRAPLLLAREVSWHPVGYMGSQAPLEGPLTYQGEAWKRIAAHPPGSHVIPGAGGLLRADSLTGLSSRAGCNARVTRFTSREFRQTHLAPGGPVGLLISCSGNCTRFASWKSRQGAAN